MKGNQSQNHETGGCRDTWRAEGAQVVHCLEEEAETEERFCSSRAAFVASLSRTNLVLLLKGFGEGSHRARSVENQPEASEQHR